MASNGRELAAIAEQALAALPAGTEFKLIDLVDPTIWAATSVGVRRSAGTVFLRNMRSDQGIACLGRDPENHQRYRKMA